VCVDAATVNDDDSATTTLVDRVEDVGTFKVLLRGSRQLNPTKIWLLFVCNPTLLDSVVVHSVSGEEKKSLSTTIQCPARRRAYQQPWVWLYYEFSLVLMAEEASYLHADDCAEFLAGCGSACCSYRCAVCSADFNSVIPSRSDTSEARSAGTVLN
jgi:hypothetical protein